MDPNVFKFSRATINDAIDQNLINYKIRDTKLVPITRYSRRATSITRITPNALRVLYYRYRRSKRIRYKIRYSSKLRD